MANCEATIWIAGGERFRKDLAEALPADLRPFCIVVNLAEPPYGALPELIVADGASAGLARPGGPLTVIVGSAAEAGLAPIGTFYLQSDDLAPMVKLIRTTVQAAAGRNVAELVRAEETARDAMLFTETALGACPIGMVTFRASGENVWANEEIARIVGCSVADIKTQNFRELESWRVGGLLAMAEDALTTGAAQQRDVDLMTTFGKRMLIHAHMVPFTFNRELHLLLLAQDITERKRAEEALQASEDTLAKVFRVIPDAIIITVPDTGEVLEVNDAYERLFGYSREEILGKTTNDLTFWTSADERARFAARLHREGHMRSQEVLLRDRHGREFWAEISADPLQLGDKACALSVVRDISGRRMTVDALNAGANFLRESQRAGRIGSFEHDVVGGEWHGSEMLYEIFGIDALYVRNVDSWIALIHPDDRRSMTDYYLNEVVGACKPFDREYRIQTPVNRQTKWVHCLGRLDVDAGGKAVRLIGTIQDVTERKMAEEALREAHDELERRVVTRTAQLQDANREQEAFSYSVSHDLRGPLRAIDGYGRILLSDYASVLDDDGRLFLNRMVDAADRMGQLVDGLLRLSRIHRVELKMEEVDLSAIAHDFDRKQRESDPNRDVDVVIAPGLVAKGDALLLASLVENLLSNAWKYTGKHAKARIEFGVETQGGASVYFVRDDGAGFDMAYAKDLFTPFHRLHRESEYPGTGVGLATARRVVERHGGKIWARGEVERGATFYFTLGA